jgi:hypothetical protein
MGTLNQNVVRAHPVPLPQAEDHPQKIVLDTGKARNPKFETRNKFKIRNPKPAALRSACARKTELRRHGFRKRPAVRIFYPCPADRQCRRGFGHLDLENCFGFRASDLLAWAATTRRCPVGKDMGKDKPPGEGTPNPRWGSCSLSCGLISNW